MKKLLIAFIATGILASCQTSDKSKDGFKITGNITGLEEGSAVLKRRVGGEWQTVDSASIQNGKFVLKGNLSMPEMCYIFVSDTLSPVRLFVENTNISITAKSDSIRYAEITGSEIQDQLDAYNQNMQVSNDQLSDIYKEYQKALKEDDQETVSKLDKKFDDIADQQKVKGLAFVKENSNSLIAPYLTWGTLVYDLTVDEMDELANGFDPSFSESIYVKQLNDHIATQKKVAVGKPLTDIVLADTTGADYALSNLKGKVILVDFWASWCGPCRRENPNVVEIYNDYKHKGFEILGVSLDEDGEAWKKAIKDDQLAWYHISDLQGWKSAGAALYGVRSIPHTVLIGEDGSIVAKNLRGGELREKIKELTSG